MTFPKKRRYTLRSEARKPVGKALRERWAVEEGGCPIPRGSGYFGALRSQGRCALVIFNGEFRQGEIRLGKDGRPTRSGSRIEVVLGSCPCYAGKTVRCGSGTDQRNPDEQGNDEEVYPGHDQSLPGQIFKNSYPGISDRGLPNEGGRELPDVFRRLVRSLSLKPYKPNLI